MGAEVPQGGSHVLLVFLVPIPLRPVLTATIKTPWTGAGVRTTITPGMPSSCPPWGPLPTFSLYLIAFLVLYPLMSCSNTTSSKKPSWISLFKQAASPPAWTSPAPLFCLSCGGGPRRTQGNRVQELSCSADSRAAPCASTLGRARGCKPRGVCAAFPGAQVMTEVALSLGRKTGKSVVGVVELWLICLPIFKIAALVFCAVPVEAPACGTHRPSLHRVSCLPLMPRLCSLP